MTYNFSMLESINIKIGGKAGEGVKITGQVLAKVFSRSGYSTFSYQEYPSLIRGGHNTFQIHLSSNETYSQVKMIDILLAFDKNTIDLHQDELKDNSIILYDNEKVELFQTDKGHYVGIPIFKIAQEVAGNPLMGNNVFLGALLALIGLPLDHLNKIIKETFKNKGEQIVKSNHECARTGYDHILKDHKDKIVDFAKPHNSSEKMVITGNEAVALGAISAGMKFFTAYPMTPATSILHYLAKEAERYGIVVKQPEDEISAINQVIGASFAGVRAMTATSGGGFCLMTEGFGFAGVSETPIVVIVSQRPGPATGMPTWSGQGDLQFMIHTAQDEFPRLILAPGDAIECFELTKVAFEMAEKYQIPTIILLDKNISESYYSNNPFASRTANKRYSFVGKQEQNYLRYKITENGISPRPFLGEKGFHHLVNSYEHDEYGFATEESKQRINMVDKRARKFEALKTEIPQQEIYGQKETEFSLISWGSNKAVIREALKSLPNVNYLHLSWVWPLPEKQIKDFAKKAKKLIVIECNSEGQLSNLIHERTGIETEKFLKYDGRPFYPEEIIEYLEALSPKCRTQNFRSGLPAGEAGFSTCSSRPKLKSTEAKSSLPPHSLSSPIKSDFSRRRIKNFKSIN